MKSCSPRAFNDGGPHQIFIISPEILAKSTTKTMRFVTPKKTASGEIVTAKVDATYTVSDRAVISALINAVKELADKNDALEARVAKLEASVR